MGFRETEKWIREAGMQPSQRGKRREEEGGDKAYIALHLIGNDALYLELKPITMAWLEINVAINSDVAEKEIGRKEKNSFYIG